LTCDHVDIVLITTNTAACFLGARNLDKTDIVSRGSIFATQALSFAFRTSWMCSITFYL
jgi:hypothetical protein